MFGSRPSPRLLGGLGALLVVSIWTSQVVAQPSPVRVVLSSEGTLYLVQSGNAWTIVPNSISATELAALTPSGELDGAIPAPFLGAPGTPSVLEAVQADDGTLYIVQGGNVWTLVAALIADADLAALTVIGEVDGEISSPSLNAPVAPAGQAPPDPVSQGTAPLPVPTPTTAVAQGEAILQPAPQCVNSVQGLVSVQSSGAV